MGGGPGLNRLSDCLFAPAPTLAESETLWQPLRPGASIKVNGARR